MAKLPPNLPAKNDVVQMRGRPQYGQGVLRYHNHTNHWCRVDWEIKGAPKICHLFELEKIDVSN